MAKIVHASEDRLTNFFNRHKAELKGEKGDQGLQGIQGDRGTKGDKGDKGEKGEKGDKGDKGEKGEKGDRGERGLQGAQGVQGVQGLQGIQGEKGDKGDKGDKGEKGDSAVDYVAAEVAKEAARAKAAEELNAKAAANAKKAIDTHTANTDNPHGVTAEQIGSYTKAESDTKLAAKLDKQHRNMSISWDDFYDHLNIKNAVLDFSLEPPGVLSGIVIGGNKLYSDEWYLSSTLNIYYKIKILTGARLTFIDNKGNEESIEDRIKRLSSLAPKYSTSSAYSVGQYVFHDGSIYRCTTAIALPGEAWNPAHWSEAQKLDDFFTSSNSLLMGTIAANSARLALDEDGEIIVTMNTED